jgi:tRNA threonylcarbamoyladenosine biosynthesis protein TsaE
VLTRFAGDEAAQEAIGAALAAALGGAPAVIYLEGDLGAGKTTLVRGLLRALGHQGTVRSPTYTLMEPYQVAGRELFHLDLYRLADPGELEYLGVRELLDGGGALLVEWPEQGRGGLPAADLVVRISHLTVGRRLTFAALSPGGRRLLEALSEAAGAVPGQV